MKIASVLAVTSMFLVVSAMPYQAEAQKKDNVLTQKEKNAGWVLLFDGTSTDAGIPLIRPVWAQPGKQITERCI